MVYKPTATQTSSSSHPHQLRSGQNYFDTSSRRVSHRGSPEKSTIESTRKSPSHPDAATLSFTESIRRTFRQRRQQHMLLIPIYAGYHLVDLLPLYVHPFRYSAALGKMEAQCIDPRQFVSCNAADDISPGTIPILPRYHSQSPRWNHRSIPGFLYRLPCQSPPSALPTNSGVPTAINIFQTHQTRYPRAWAFILRIGRTTVAATDCGCCLPLPLGRPEAALAGTRG